MSNTKDMLLIAHDQFKKMMSERTDPRWASVLKIAETGHLDGAANLAAVIIDENSKAHREPGRSDESQSNLDDIQDLIERQISQMVVSTLSNLASLRPAMSDAVIKMLCAGGEAGYEQCAYNAANALQMIAKTPTEWKRVAHYYKLSIDQAVDPSLKAASYVNYCPIVRDGLITGQRDFPTAISIYEKAAELGLIIGMFNTANVSLWVNADGDPQYVPKAAYWLEKIIQHIDEKKPMLDMDNEPSNAMIYTNAHFMLAQIHIGKCIPDHDSDYGLRLMDRVTPRDKAQIDLKRQLKEDAVANRIAALKKPEKMSFGEHWRYVLNCMGWQTSASTRLGSLPVEVFEVRNSAQSKPICFAVLHFIFNPYGELKCAREIARLIIAELGYANVFVAPAYGMFQSKGLKAHTPVIHFDAKGHHLLSLHPQATPEELLENSRNDVPFFDERFGSLSCVIPIAINRLNSDVPVDDGFDFRSPFIRWEDWSIPMHNGRLPDIQSIE